MFSVLTPRTSSRPRPPTPMHAMLSVSLGARIPRPRTCRGTMVKARPAPTLPTNVRLEMRLRAIVSVLFEQISGSSAPSVIGLQVRDDAPGDRLRNLRTMHEIGRAHV